MWICGGLWRIVEEDMWLCDESCSRGCGFAENRGPGCVWRVVEVRSWLCGEV